MCEKVSALRHDMEQRAESELCAQMMNALVSSDESVDQAGLDRLLGLRPGQRSEAVLPLPRPDLTVVK